MTTHPPGDKIRALAHKLIGTCGIETIDELSDLERHECRQLDMLAFACSGCGWWFAITERHEAHDEWFCGECVKKEVEPQMVHNAWKKGRLDQS